MRNAFYYLRRALVAGSLLSVLLLTLVMQDRQARAVGLGDVVKVGGIAAAVTIFGKDINNFINGLYQRHGVATRQSTKVVAILSIGAGTHLGAAQVIGPRNLIDSVRAVAQGEAQPGPLRLRALIPIASRNISKGQLRTVGGVGVGAVIDFKI